MKPVLFLFSLFLASVSYSSVGLYQIDVRSAYGESKLSRTKLVLRDGEEAVYVDSHENTIEVVASEHTVGDGQNIQLDFVISREDGNGNIMILSAPKIITAQNIKSEIETSTDKGERISLIVKVKRL